MTTKKRLIVFATTGLLVSLPFVAIHLLAQPDDAPISPLQRLVAALANFLGPWGVALVRLVDFPNAGLRSFSWTLALALTLSGILLVGLVLWTRSRWAQYLMMGCWALFLLVWFGVGLRQIADGLL